MLEKVSLTDMDEKKTGTVVELLGGRGIQNRLRALGIRPGAKLTKISTTFMRGPVVVRVGNTQAALGFGMSHKVIVEVER